MGAPKRRIAETATARDSEAYNPRSRGPTRALVGRVSIDEARALDDGMARERSATVNGAVRDALGDCQEYALAGSTGEPLLLKRVNFPGTDVAAV